MNLTNREKEILAYLKAHPMISQDELAAYFSITRSSAAVHVSNLMKKGAVLGKGYIFEKKQDLTIEVIGRRCLYAIGELSEIDDGKENEPVLRVGFAYKIKELLDRFGVSIKITSVNEPSAFSLSADTDNTKEKWRRWNGYCLVPEDYFNQRDYYETVEINNGQSRWLILESDLQPSVLHTWLKDPQNGLNLCGGFYLEDEKDLFGYLLPWSLLVIGVHRETNIDGIIESIMESDIKNVVVSDGEERLYYFQAQEINEFILAPKQCFDPCQDLPYFLGGLVFGLASGYNLRHTIRIALGRMYHIIQ